jgi:hypothetical protein
VQYVWMVPYFAADREGSEWVSYASAVSEVVDEPRVEPPLHRHQAKQEHVLVFWREGRFENFLSSSGKENSLFFCVLAKKKHAPRVAFFLSLSLSDKAVKIFAMLLRTHLESLLYLPHSCYIIICNI